jgi:hypothetical protein
VSDVPPPLPAFVSWPTFPFEGELRVKPLEEPVDAEPPRHGEDPAECSACRARDDAYIWVTDRWRVRALDRPTGLPMVLILESRSHLDLGDLPNMLAAELGVLTVRLERAIRSLDGVARVHVNRWGDGSAHLHMWFLARPLGRLQLRGTFLSLWDDILPRVPEGKWREDLALVAAWLAEFGGRALAEPPHIEWQAPSLLNLPDTSDTATDAVLDGVTTVAEDDDPEEADSAGAQGPEETAGVQEAAADGSPAIAPVDSPQDRPSAPRGSSGTPKRTPTRLGKSHRRSTGRNGGRADVARQEPATDGDQADAGSAGAKTTSEVEAASVDPPRERPTVPGARKAEDRAAAAGGREAGGDAIASGLSSGR